MKPLFTAAALTVGGALAAVTITAPADAATPSTNQPPIGAVFVQTDDPSGNAIVAYARHSDGSLTQAAIYATGGLGGVLTGSVVDHTASQGALAYDKHSQLLYAVNAGSNTISTFAVIGDRLVRRQVISSGGEFPVSIAVHGNLVYVLNARGGGSIQGYIQLAGTLIPIAAWHRSLGLNLDQTPEFTSTPGQVAFTPDGSRLIVTTKNGADTIDVFRLGLLGPSAEPAVTSLPGAVPFAVSFDADGALAVAEAGTNAVATFRLNADDSLTQLDYSATGQAGTCWITTADGKLYLANAGSATVSGYRVSGDGSLTLLGTKGTDRGTVDLTASPDGRDLYVRTGVAGDIDAYAVNSNGSLTLLGSIPVPDGIGGEGIVAS